MIYWQSLADFLAMGSHGPYVWGAFAAVALVLLGEPLLAVRRLRRTERRLERQIRAGHASAPQKESP